MPRNQKTNPWIITNFIFFQISDIRGEREKKPSWVDTGWGESWGNWRKGRNRIKIYKSLLVKISKRLMQTLYVINLTNDQINNMRWGYLFFYRLIPTTRGIMRQINFNMCSGSRGRNKIVVHFYISFILKVNYLWEAWFKMVNLLIMINLL